jgi:demethylmenaquinone methyltransferase/2-methoxy-6-polyprenyl-1,4-benzoquinol methylase
MKPVRHDDTATDQGAADGTTHFGYEQVPEREKARKVAGVFESVASRYDLMNDLMSAGLHRWWKRYAVEQSRVRPGERVLDVAGGTGDLTRLFSDRVGANGMVVLTDINGAMLTRGRDRLLDEGYAVPALQCDAEHLPFPDEIFDCVCVAFGLRNMTHKDLALREMTRVLRAGGRLVVLEFSQVWKPLAPLYDLYSFRVLPRLGDIIAKDAASYRYLAESIRMHPDQESLKMMMEQAGLERVEYYNLAAGVVALHRGYKL